MLLLKPISLLASYRENLEDVQQNTDRQFDFPYKRLNIYYWRRTTGRHKSPCLRARKLPRASDTGAIRIRVPSVRPAYDRRDRRAGPRSIFRWRRAPAEVSGRE